MAIKILEEQIPDALRLELNNGDFKVLNEIVHNWNFKDQVSALRFALAVLKIAKSGTLSKNENGDVSPLIPNANLLSTEQKDGESTK